jgi:hypothetical protein
MAGVLPPNTSYFMQRLQGFSTSHFKILPQTTGTMSANSIIRFELPSNSYVNFGKGGMRMFFKASTAGSGGRLPNGLDKLIERVAIYAGGTLIQNNFNGYNVLRAAKEALGAPKLCASTGHPEIVRAKSYHDGSTLTGTGNEAYASDNDCFCIDMWEGFLGSVAPAIIDLGLCPAISVEITLAADAVCPSVAGIALDGTGSVDITDNGAGATYSLSEISLQVEVIGMASSVLDEIAEQRISSVGYLSLPFKNYFTSVSSHTGSTRFSVNSASLDRIWICYRASAFGTQKAAHTIPGYKVKGAFVDDNAGDTAADIDVGIPSYDVGGVLDTNKEKYISQYFRFQELLSSATDTATFSLQINGASVPAYKMNRVEALAMTKGAVEAYGKVDDTLTLNQYTDSYFVQCYRFCLPESEYSRTASGLDTRSVSAICSLETENLSNCHVTIISEVTSELRVGSGRAISVIQ